MHRPLSCIALGAVLCAAAAGAAAQDEQALRTRALAATCANCHGTDGHAIPDSAIPGLAGMPAGYFMEQLRGFRQGTRSATVMHQIAKGFDDGQIERLAAYFAAQPK